MGLDRKGVNTVFHYGPPHDLDDYIKESGRVGRNPSSDCFAVFFAFKRSTGQADKDMKNYCNDSKVCKRLLLFRTFDSSVNSGVIGHTCCSLC